MNNNDFQRANCRVRHLRRAACAAFALLAAGVLLTACGSKPPKPEPARLRLVAGADANPDSSGRPSPVVVRVFQLRADGEFAAADFFALYDKEKETLGQSLIARQEYVLVPGETRQLELSLDPQARYVGAVAAFRDIRSARWRVLTRAPEKKLTDLFKKDGVTISVEKDSLTLSAQH